MSATPGGTTSAPLGFRGTPTRLPLLLSVPHAGLRTPPEIERYSILAPQDIAADGDGGAADIYDLEHLVVAYQTTDVARVFVDLNRAEDDRGRDGAVKTHTCWNVPVYDPFPPDAVVESLLERYHRPYHAGLRSAGSTPGVLLGIDCHTMAGEGPPVGPDPGVTRPAVCLSDGDGACPMEWVEELARCFQEALEVVIEGTLTPASRSVAGEPGPPRVAVNDPFKGGHIIRAHARELPWVQVELSRAPYLDDTGKRTLVARALEWFCSRVFSHGVGRSGS